MWSPSTVRLVAGVERDHWDGNKLAMELTLLLLRAAAAAPAEKGEQSAEYEQRHQNGKRHRQANQLRRTRRALRRTRTAPSHTVQASVVSQSSDRLEKERVT